MFETASRGLACVFAGQRRALLYDLEEDEEGQDDDMEWSWIRSRVCTTFRGLSWSTHWEPQIGRLYATHWSVKCNHFSVSLELFLTSRYGSALNASQQVDSFCSSDIMQLEKDFGPTARQETCTNYHQLLEVLCSSQKHCSCPTRSDLGYMSISDGDEFFFDFFLLFSNQVASSII